MPRDGRLVFKDFPEFRPNLTPRQMFQRGIFGGTYWRPIKSGVTGKSYRNVHKRKRYSKVFDGIPDSKLSAAERDLSVNKYKVWSGASLEEWESKGWIKAQDPYGWVQWYTEFWLGRRSEDDARQIKRWLGVAGPRGRFSRRLRNMREAGKDSPKIAQLLLQWAVSDS